MRDWLKSRSLWQRGFAAIAAVCIVMLLLLSTAQLVHTHAVGHSDRDCALCYSAHQSVQPTAQIILHHAEVSVAQTILPWTANRPTHNVILLPVNRPPPADPVLA